MTLRQIATARPVFEVVSQRIGVDTDILMYLFGECLTEVFKQVDATGTCTIRGHGKFSVVPLEAFGKAKSTELLTVFERSKYVKANRPFRALQLKTRLTVNAPKN